MCFAYDVELGRRVGRRGWGLETEEESMKIRIEKKRPFNESVARLESESKWNIMTADL